MLLDKGRRVRREKRSLLEFVLHEFIVHINDVLQGIDAPCEHTIRDGNGLQKGDDSFHNSMRGLDCPLARKRDCPELGSAASTSLDSGSWDSALCLTAGNWDPRSWEFSSETSPHSQPENAAGGAELSQVNSALPHFVQCSRARQCCQTSSSAVGAGTVLSQGSQFQGGFQ